MVGRNSSSAVVLNLKPHTTLSQPSNYVAPSQPPSKKRKPSPKPPVTRPQVDTGKLPSDLGKFVERDAALLKRLGWKKFINSRRQRGDLSDLRRLNHPAVRLLKHYQTHGAPVKFSSKPWSRQDIEKALHRGPHKSCHEYHKFLSEEFVDMIDKQQWVVLPYSEARKLPNLRLSPPGVVPQRNRRPRWIVDYSFYGVNADTLDLAAREAMQFGHALDRILREILLANPDDGPVQLMKVDLSDGFYRIDLCVDDIPKLGVLFPTAPGEPKLVAFPLVLPMGWKNSPALFSTATETIADLANTKIASSTASDAPQHALDDLAASILSPTPAHALPTLISGKIPSLTVPVERDPSLPSVPSALAYIDVFVDDFIACAQGRNRGRQVRRILFQAIDSVFRPLEESDPSTRREPISMKKLLQGDCSWGTIKTILGWIINTVTQTIHLPAHRQERLAEILAEIPKSQKRISIKRWHRVLGELRSMSLALPGSRALFSQMQHALTTQKGARVALNKGVHQALDDFRWLLNDIASRPTRIAEVVPLNSSAEGHHDASGTGAGGVWFPSSHLNPRGKFDHKPILWRYKWPDDIIANLVTTENPSGTVTNSDLELAGGLIHLEAIAQTFDVRERTFLSKTDNLATLFWQRKGSATTDKVPAHLLRLFGIHQRYHRYVPRHDYLSGPSNPMADDSSRLFDLSDEELLIYFNAKYSLCPKQNDTFQLWTPSPQLLSAVTSALRNKPSKPESLLVEPEPPTACGNSGTRSALNWPLIPFSKPSRTKYLSYKSSHNEFALEALQETAIPSGLDRLKITYGTLPRRSLQWGPKTHV